MYEEDGSKKKKTGFQKFTMVMVWLMIIVTILGVVLGAAGGLGLI
ncbi:DUF4044 domain-containing protein [Periweissella cryptocerci]|uniref:DUF4044 domain-containing protein n=1 Tax=Periweissella cryptocerci TaxID=2506420 RepID=A0A4P6YRZ6_9LACO|nr:DUF4044 domain-containing protein [Periweissella cryptocerci]QBO35448.1 DUF4044 domain-containing protein [Periweissella cryptocerci]